MSLIKQTYIIKTLKKSINICNSVESMKLLTSQIVKILKKDQKYLHLGLVQIAIKPMMRGLYASLLTCPRDNRHNKFQDFLL